ncbi:CIR protein PIR protein [Plasmodium vinckei brucechwatti]|uniref:CIR protein PIR protein n=1 Tax=Plasmodium vinckei brucechwatti TaxID=119398 RepID=A0A6V7RV13_PLAVN|nr:CIR protein PIR protein [Plasmodium vinckei brucechwatti]
MANYNIEAVYKEISTIDGEFGVNMNQGHASEFANSSIRKYCYLKSANRYGICYDYLRMASSGVINLLDNLKKYNLEYDKLAEYAILFLSYKLKQHSEHKSTNLNTVYTKDIEINKYYNNKIKDKGPTYKEIIDKKKDLMNTNEISKFNEAFSILCKLYTECDKKKSYANCSNDARDFAKNFENLNQDSSITGNSSYREILSILSSDYDNFKSYCSEKCNDCNDLPTLPKIKTPLTKLIPVLSTFPVIPVFLGIAYKTIFKKKIKKSKEENET